MILPIILSGGAGSRLWPLSRELFPKQLLPLLGNGSLLQATLTRLNNIENTLAPLVICNEQHRFMVAEQLREIQVTPSAMILEPMGRNTAPAIAIAALHAVMDGQDPLLLVLPADHVIRNEERFAEMVMTGREFARQGQLLTFGIVPAKPETAYGYIKAGSVLSDQAYQVEQFIEKPNLLIAQQYLAEGGYYWNSGMFMFRASVILKELGQYAPDILQAAQKIMESLSQDRDFIRIDAATFEQCPSDSIDYAVMEKTKNAVMISAQLDWNDLGSWNALWEVGEQDGDGNILDGDVHVHNSRNCYLHADHRMLAVIGLEECVVMETADAVLVAHKDHVQDVKKMVERLKRDGREEVSLHRRVYRPWGSYESVDESAHFKVKRITVNPGASLSLQMHHHRSEHWVVVSGTAQVTCGDDVFMLEQNQSTYIPVGMTHRLANPGTQPVELIEVQSGHYLGEDDIVRFEDVYGRESQ